MKMSSIPSGAQLTRERDDQLINIWVFFAPFL